MIFAINKLKYDTEKMELISDKCEYKLEWKNSYLRRNIFYTAKDVKLWKSKKNNWLLTYSEDLGSYTGKALNEKEAKNLLLRYDYEAYEKIFGELEEA